MSSDSVITLREVRSATEVLNATFRFIRQNALILGRSLLYINGPVVVLSLVFTSFFQIRFLSLGQMVEASGEELLAEMGPAFLGMAGGVILGILSSILAVLIVLGIMLLYQDRGPEAFDVPDVWRLVKRDFWRMLGTGLVFWLAFLLPVVIVIVPCLGVLAYLAWVLYAATTFSLIFPMRMREDIGLWRGVQRCRDLVRDHFWSTLGVLFLAFILYSVLGTVFTFPSSVIAFLYGLHGGDPGGTWYEAGLVVASVVGGIGTTVLYCIPLVALAFQYFNLVERKEHVGLMGRVERMEDEASAPSAEDDEGGPLESDRWDDEGESGTRDQ